MVSIMKASPLAGQLGSRLSRSPHLLRAPKALQVKGVLPREHGVHRPGQFMGQHGQRLPFAVFAFQLSEVFFTRLVLAQEEHGGFRESPLELGVANLFAREAIPLAG
jgi:hypothetical protein